MQEEYLDPMVESPISCEDTTEYDNRIEDDCEVEPEEEHEDHESPVQREENEQEFARFERNYRARRIRELTEGPARKHKKTGRENIHKLAA